jgi:hypothetical protein
MNQSSPKRLHSRFHNRDLSATPYVEVGRDQDVLRTEIEVQPLEMRSIPRVEADSRFPRGDFSFRTRSTNLQRLCREEFDVAVIGGGATGPVSPGMPRYEE